MNLTNLWIKKVYTKAVTLTGFTVQIFQLEILVESRKTIQKFLILVEILFYSKNTMCK